MLDYQSRVCKFDPPLFLSFRRDFKPRSNFRMAYVMVGGQMPEYTVIKIVEGTHPFINPIALRKAKIVYNFNLSVCNRVNCLLVGHLPFAIFLEGL